MNGLRRTVGVACALVSLASGCGSGDEAAPTAPASPPAPPSTPAELRLVPIGFGGPLFQPDATLRIARGARIILPVMTSAPRLVEAGPGVSVLVRTDAPQSVLSVSPKVWVAGSDNPGLVEVQTLAGSVTSEPSGAYRVWLEEDPAAQWAPGWGPEVDAGAVRIAVEETRPPPPACESLELTARAATGEGDGGERARLTFGAAAATYSSGAITLRTDHPETSLSLLSRYRMPYEDLDPESDRARVTYRPYPTAFAFGLRFRETGVGFEQTMTLGWFDDLHLRAEAPGCDPVQLSCDRDGRCSPGNPVP